MVPDIALINVGAEAAAMSVAAAKSEVDRLIEAISTALRESGVERRDIQSSNYSIYFEREAYDSAAELAELPVRGRYWVSNMLRVTVRDVDRAGAVLDSAVKAGANQVWGVSFEVSDKSSWQSRARRSAMEDAVAKATELAGLAGANLGEVISVNEVGGGPQFMETGYGGGGGGIEPGELKMGVQLQVTFAVR
jgi:uncharacterized protein YggE